MFLKLVAGIADRDNRYKGATLLAEYFGCSFLLILIRDEELDLLLPAPGFPQTLPLNKQWEDFLVETGIQSYYRSSLPYPDKHSLMTATGLSGPDHSVALLFGGEPDAEELQPLADLLPVLISLFAQEQESILARSVASFAKNAASKAEKLANTIDNMRLQLTEALVKQEKDRQAIAHLLEKKDEFINIASHELKTPVTSLKASLQVLLRLKDNPASPMFPRLIDQANKSMEKMSGLLEDLLNVNRISEGQLQLDKKFFTVSHMLKACCDHIRIDGGHELILQGDLELAIYADENRIDQVIVNFVNNAVKYAPESQHIYLTVEKDKNNMAKVAVRDNGPGIAPEKLPHLFDRYFRADYSGSQYSGLGLGLYICAEIIKRHNGQIGVESEEGKGATFWFTIPISG